MHDGEYVTVKIDSDEDVLHYFLSEGFQAAPHGLIYAIGSAAGGLPVKIGHAMNPVTRLPELQTGSFVTLSILAVAPGSVKMEKAFHRQMTAAGDHIRGEWFIGSELQKIVDGLRLFAAHAVFQYAEVGEMPSVLEPLMMRRVIATESARERAQQRNVAIEPPPSYIAQESVGKSIGRYNHALGRGRKTSGILELEEMRIEGKLPDRIPARPAQG